VLNNVARYNRSATFSPLRTPRHRLSGCVPFTDRSFRIPLNGVCVHRGGGIY